MLLLGNQIVVVGSLTDTEVEVHTLRQVGHRLRHDQATYDCAAAEPSVRVGVQTDGVLARGVGVEGESPRGCNE